MKLTKQDLTNIIKEELEENPLMLKALEKLLQKLEKLDTSIDFLSAAVTGMDPYAITAAQSIYGRTARPEMRRQQEGPPMAEGKKRKGKEKGLN